MLSVNDYSFFLMIILIIIIILTCVLIFEFPNEKKTVLPAILKGNFKKEERNELRLKKMLPFYIFVT